jgi:Uma2 family endonuclease
MSAAPPLRPEDVVPVPRAAFTHEGFRAWAISPEFPSGVRAAFIDGEVLLEMSPEELETHAKVKLEITTSIAHWVKERDLGEVYPDGVLVSNPAAGLSCEPDLTFVSWASFDARRARLVTKRGRFDRYVEIEGSPDLVVEVISDSSVRKDRDLLRGAYQRAGVSEYWIVDARGEEIGLEILRNDGDAFVAVAAAVEPQPSGVLGGTWRLLRSRNRQGRFSYELRTA